MHFNATGISGRCHGTQRRKNLISENRCVSFRTGKPIVYGSFSVIRDHSGQKVREEDFKIILKCNNTSDLRISESYVLLRINLTLRAMSVKLGYV